VIDVISTVINFPFTGYQKGDLREELFWQIVETSHKAAAEPIIVVIGEDTIARDGAEAFLGDPRVTQYGLHVHRTWSVDTCQTWLAGWAVALRMQPCTGVTGGQPHYLPMPGDDDRIVLLPGDIDAIADRRAFFAAGLRGFLSMNGFSDIVVGDFETGEKLGSKDLIDLYGTYPLFALWFPEIAVATRDKSIWKPRSEFLNVRVRVLRELLLSKRKFAYEQTLNMLIHSWDFAKSGWKYHIVAHRLGVLADDPDSRSIPGSIDQIERTERMLKMIWREFQFSDAGVRARKAAGQAAALAAADEVSAAYKEAYKTEFDRVLRWESAQILEQYDRLESTSRAIEAVARVTVLSFIAQ